MGAYSVLDRCFNFVHKIRITLKGASRPWCNSKSFPVNIAKFLRKPISKNISERLHLYLPTWPFDNKYTVDKYTVLEFQFRSVKCTIAARLRKNFNEFVIPMQAIQGDYSVWYKQRTSTSFQTCLYYVYTYSNYTINQLLYRWQIIQLKFEAK